MSIAPNHYDRDALYGKAKDFRRMIKMTLDSCTDPFVCLKCRVKLNFYIDALLHLPETIMEPPDGL